jgi:hypothetical protein
VKAPVLDCVDVSHELDSILREGLFVRGVVGTARVLRVRGARQQCCVPTADRKAREGITSFTHGQHLAEQHWRQNPSAGRRRICYTRAVTRRP